MTQQIDKAAAEAFAGKMVETINGGFLALITSVGHRTGLFDAMAKLPPSTSDEIASVAGLNERYVREWLATMTVGRMVEYDATTRKYRLPPEHAASVTQAAGAGNLAAIAQYVSLMGKVEDEIVDSFRNGGGVPYSSYGRFHPIMAEQSGGIFDATLIDSTLPLVPGLVDRLKAGIDVADVGCGSGHAINLMATEFPNSRFTGIDFSEEGIAAGRAEAEKIGLPNASFEVEDAALMSRAGSFDFITTFDSIHDQAQPRKVLKNIADAIRPDGTYLMVDIRADSEVQNNMDHPLAPFLYAISTMHCMTVSLALDGEGLGTMWGEQKARELLAEAGFGHVEVESVQGDIFNSFYIATKA
jgi:2-polyprenyl-3-methyl-5-hydroxy-6-metoxy-1,4-benzoquinol methylase